MRHFLETFAGSLFDNVFCGLAVYQVIDGEIYIYAINKTVERWEKVRREDIEGKRLLDIFPGAKQMGLVDLILETSRTGEHRSLPTTFYIDEERSGWRENEIHPLKITREEAGDLEIPGGLVLVVYKDITEIVNTRHQLEQSLTRLKETLSSTITQFGTIIELRDPYTAEHQKRVAALSKLICEMMGINGEMSYRIGLAAGIHDIGKISIPAEILAKPTRLSNIETDLIQTHVQAGYNILKEIDFGFTLAEIVYQHHERLNGSGYPNHRTANEILLEAKIIGVADVFEAMVSHRPYRPALAIELGLQELRNGRGILYDAAVVDACQKVVLDKKFAP